MPPQDSEQSLWFAKHLQPHESMLLSWLQARFPAECDLEDIIQESYMKVLMAREKQELRAPKAFLFATARNLAVDRLRHLNVAQNEVLVENELSHVWEEDMGTPEVVARNQELEILTKAIQSLPKRCRQVFTLRKVYGMSQKDIAHELAISEHTVSAQLTIGLHKCRDYVERYSREGSL